MELDCTITVARYTLTILHLRRVATASFVADRCYMEIRLIRVPPKSLLHRIVINKVIKISWICTLIVRSSLLTLPSQWALSIHALPLNCHDRTIHLDMVEA